MNFGTLMSPQAEQIYRYFLGRPPSEEENSWLLSNANDPWPTNGVMCFSQPWDNTKATLLVYACCHGWQLLHYWANHGNNYIRNAFNVVLVQNYRVMGDANYQGQASGQPRADKIMEPIPHVYSDLFRAMCSKASWVVYHPAYDGTIFDPENLFEWPVGYDNEQRTVSFHSPSFAAFWPVSHFGDEHILHYLRTKEYSPKQLKSALRSGSLFCNYDVRFELGRSRLYSKDSRVKCGIAEFFLKYWTTHRMFLAFNHPSYHLMAYQGAKLCNYIERGECSIHHDAEQFVLDLGDNEARLPAWPDHKSTWKHFPFQFPMKYRVEEADAFYSHWIDDLQQKVTKENETTK